MVSGASRTGSKDGVRDRVMRVRSTSDIDMRGWAFLTGDGVASPIASIIKSARASSDLEPGISRVGTECPNTDDVSSEAERSENDVGCDGTGEPSEVQEDDSAGRTCCGYTVGIDSRSVSG